MNILDKIIVDKIREVELKKSIVSISQLEKSELFKRSGQSLAKNLQQSKTGIIAEHKRRSPSKSVINQSLNVEEVVSGYENAGASGISVLTDGKYFGGSLDDLLFARASVEIPVLRKDFMIDEYQIIEAKAFGADVIMLIAAVLEEEELKKFSEIAKNLGMDVLLEIHNQEELEKSIDTNADMIGINNRNLKTFEVDIENSIRLANSLPDKFVKVAESGLSDTAVVKKLRQNGFDGFLIGENFMKSQHPGKEATKFIRELS